MDLLVGWGSAEGLVTAVGIESDKMVESNGKGSWVEDYEWSDGKEEWLDTTQGSQESIGISGILTGVTKVSKPPSVVLSTPRIRGSIKSVAIVEKGKTFS